MCKLCSKDDGERKAAKEEAAYRAKQFEEMAYVERRLAAGVLKPHSEDAKFSSATARSLIRYLVEEWM